MLVVLPNGRPSIHRLFSGLSRTLWPPKAIRKRILHYHQRRCPDARQSLISLIEELARDIPVSFMGPAFFPIIACGSRRI